MTQLNDLNDKVIKPAAYEVPGQVAAAPKFKITIVHFVLFVLAVLCLAFIGFITFARSIQVNVYTLDIQNPDVRHAQVANIQLEGWLKLPIGNRFMLLPGEKKFTASAPGFITLQDSLTVVDERYQQFDVLLSPLPGKLDITLDPNIAANVSIGDVVIGQLPGLIEEVPPGLHTITVDAPLYRQTAKTILVTGKDATESLDFVLEPAWAEVVINTQPEGASLSIDDKIYGVTPLNFKLEEGVHSFMLSADGYKTHNTDVVIVAQENSVLQDIVLKPADAVLQVNTTPTSAAIIVNGKYVGISPMAISLLPDNEHLLQVYKAGHELHDATINMTPNQQESVDLVLADDLVPVEFSVSPNDATIVIDGVNRGVGNQTLYLTSLQHQIRVTKSGYAEYQASIIPTRANQQIVSVNLKTIEEDFWAKVPSEYKTSVGQTMRLFKSPGQVQMGSRRGEDGRRENEIRYTAELTRHFYVSEKEVTNKEFRAFNESHNAGNYKRKSLDSSQHPAVNISWQQAALFCNWLSETEGLEKFYLTEAGYVAGVNSAAGGYRLPTEVEWEWLARNNNNEVLLYPWGSANSLNGSAPVGNFADDEAKELIAFTLEGYDDGYVASSPVGRFPPNHRGLYDLEGNASEWVNDWYSARGNLDSGKLVNPLGPEIGEFHVVRGGSWAKGYLPQLRLAYRDFGAKGKHDIGFRVARYVVPPK